MEKEFEGRIRDLTNLVRSEANSLSGFARVNLLRVMRSPQREDVEDVLSDAYLAAATRLRREPSLEVQNLGAWFRKVLFFRCLQYGKKWREGKWAKSLEDLENEDQVLEILHQAEKSHSTTETTLLVDECLSKLDDRERQVLVLAAQGYTSREIGNKFKETPENIRKIKSRAIEKLRNLLLGEYPQ